MSWVFPQLAGKWISVRERITEWGISIKKNTAFQMFRIQNDVVLRSTGDSDSANWGGMERHYRWEALLRSEMEGRRSVRGCFNESKHTLVRSAQTVIAEARAYTTTEVQYEKNEWAWRGAFLYPVPAHERTSAAQATAHAKCRKCENVNSKCEKNIKKYKKFLCF